MGIRQNFNSTKSFITRHKVVLSLGLGSVIVMLWTLVRFFDLPTIYDMVTQQLIARSWAHGIVAPIQMGPTNYLLKVVLIYMPLEFLPGSARAHIIFSTLAINVITFLLLYVVVTRLIREIAPKLKPQLYRSMLWLSLVAGSVFWIQFANSRNLEVVGGCFLIERALRYKRLPTQRLGAFIVLYSAVLFFADPLQIYMTAMPAAIFLYIDARKPLPRRVLFIALLLALGAIISKLIFKLVASVASITFIGGSQLSARWTPTLLLKAAFRSLREVIALTAGKSELGVPYQLLLVCVVILALYLFVRSVLKGYVPRKVALFTGTFIVSNLVVYTLSGQSLQPGTSRYLIMIVPALMIILATLKDELTSREFKIKPLITVLAASAVACLLSLLFTWHPSQRSDQRLEKINQNIIAANYTHVYGSMDTALPLDYYLNTESPRIAALACSPDGLVLALSKPMLSSLETDDEAAVIFDGQSIANSPFVCSADMLIGRLGKPIRSLQTAGGNQVLVYPDRLLSGVLSR